MRDNSTLLHRLSLWAQDQPDAPALNFKSEDSDAWSSITVKDHWRTIVQIAEGLQASGFKPGDPVLIYAKSSPEWIQWELGVLLAGGICVGAHPHLLDRDLYSIFEQVKPKLALVQSDLFRERLNGGAVQIGLQVSVYTFAEANALFMKEIDPEHSTLLQKVNPDATQFLIFTSGTTGTPKGVMLGLRQLTYVSDLLAREWNLPFADGTLFSFLPLSHVAEKIQSLGVAITERYPIWFNSKYESFFSEFKEVRPSLFLAVPSIWDRFKERIEAQKPKLLQRMMELERLGSVAERLYLNQAKEHIGLDRLRFAVSGAVKLPPSTGEWFKKVGIEIQEIYGMSEACGLATLTHAPREDFLSVGMPPVGIEVKILADGEICVKGQNVFNGYWQDPALTKTLLLEEGWLRTGDLGEWKPDLLIIGRNRDIIKLSNGRMIAPEPIENTLREIPEISNVCLIGDGQYGLLALITLKDSVLMEYKFIPGAIEGLAVEVDELKDKIRTSIDTLMAQKKIQEKIQSFIILSREFSADQQELTLTQKLNRVRIHQNFRHFIQFKMEEHF
jgi:long-chain acyl-CoA synthetase